MAGRDQQLFVRRVNRELASVIDGSEYRFFHHLTVPDYDGTAHIDHLIVSPFGVFVIETKNYSGWIYGSESQPTWTHVFHRRKYKFQNPLRQNYNHLKAIQKLTDSEMNSITRQIKAQRLKRGFLTNRRHRRHIEEVLKKPTCPRCQQRSE